jgi:hypothetical protein
MSDLVAYGIGVVIAVALLVAGHYFWLMPGRRNLTRPEAYTVGTACCFIGTGTVCLLLGTWLLPWWYNLVVFAIGGLLTFSLYHVDSTAEKDHQLQDQQEEIVLLRHQIATHEGLEAP